MERVVELVDGDRAAALVDEPAGKVEHVLVADVLDPVGVERGDVDDRAGPLRRGGRRLRRVRDVLVPGAADDDAVAGERRAPLVAPQLLEAQLGPREDRDPEARLFSGSGADALRTSIAKARRAAGIPLFSPHDLRHRRISLLHLRGVPWASIGEQVGQRKLSVTADIYTHVLSDETELDYGTLLSP